MRVITGLARGAKLETLEGMELRPTADRVKESVFNMLQFELEGRRVLDLFAGSGQLGIEALSRGAALAVFVDANPEAVEVIKKNLQHTRLFEKSRVVSSDYESYLRHAKQEFDVALIDPPYGKGLAQAAFPLAAALMSAQGVIICEVAARDPLPEPEGGFALVRRSVYSKTAVGVYRRLLPEAPVEGEAADSGSAGGNGE